MNTNASPRILIAGASGLIGCALASSLRARGCTVLRLVRREARGGDEIPWNPARGELDAARLEGVDAVVNLSGENVGAGRWTAARRERILRSRVDATRTLVAAMGKMARKPAVFISASATGFYGSRGDEKLTEASAIGAGFLPEVCLAWETHAEGAARLGVRTVLVRFGLVLGRRGGALPKMLPWFRLGLGGRLGAGRQWMSWISAADAAGAIQHAWLNESCRGPINAVAPLPLTNAEFARTLGRMLGRPAVLPAPAWALQLVFGRMAGETLLTSVRALPARLEATGYVFQHPTLEAAVRAVLAERREV